MSNKFKVAVLTGLICASCVRFYHSQDEVTEKAGTEEFSENLTEDIISILESEKVSEEAEKLIPLKDRFDIPVVLNEKVNFFIKYFTTDGREIMETYLRRSGRYVNMMKKILKERGLPEDLVYMALIESGFNPRAFSRARAAGPWQFIRSTARRYGLRVDFWVDERRDPIKSTIAASEYLKDLYDRLGHWYLAAAGYNAGENKVIKAIRRTGSEDFWELAETRYLRKETKDYVPKLLAAAIIAKNPEIYGFNGIETEEEFVFDVVKVRGVVDLALVSKVCGISMKKLRFLNPELRRWFTPPDVKEYNLRVPEGRGKMCELAIKKIPRKKWVKFKRYRIKSGDTLWEIAMKFGVSVWEIKRLNNIWNHRRLRLGKVVLIPVRHYVKPRKTFYGRGRKLYRKAYSKSENALFYTVKPGDTLWDISLKFGVRIRDLKKWNRIPRRNLIRPGDVIVILIEGKS